MARKKIETVDEQPEETIAVEQEQPVDTSLPWTDDPEAPRHGVSFTLPRGVLVALLDPDHMLADVEGAQHLGLLDDASALTPIGSYVAKAFDAVAVGHKMSAAWRAAHNAELDNRK